MDGNNILSLKSENDDNLIENNSKEEKEDSIMTNKYTDKFKYKLNYAELLSAIRERDEKHRNNSEFFCNILLIPPDIELSDRISTLSMISYCYQLSENLDNIYLITNKFEKYIETIKNVDQNFCLNIFSRAAYFFQKQKNYFYAYKYILKCTDLIKNYSKFSKKKKEIVIGYHESMKNDLINYIKNKEDVFNNPEIFTINKCEELYKLIELIVNEDYNIDTKVEESNNNYIYAVNKDWIFKVKLFIEPFMKSNDRKDFIKKVFDPLKVFDYYFDKKKINIYSIYPGPINNYPLISFKDTWKDDKNLDENDFLKKSIEINRDYIFINSKDWKFLKEIFDSTNEIKRKKNNLDLIKIKFLLLDKRINVSNDNTFLLEQKYIQINKNSTLNKLKNKILYCVNNELQRYNEKKKYSQNVFFYILNKEKKFLLIEIIKAFVSQIQMYESIYIKKLEFQDNNTLNELFLQYNKNEHILIIEILDKSDINFLIQMDNNYKCNICGEKIQNLNQKYNCDICHFSLFCTKRCANNSNEHKIIDKALKKIMEQKFNISDLFSIEFGSFLSNGMNLGRVGLKNLGNTSHLNSVLQCLSNTIDLTKYFLKELFKKEINSGNYFGTRGEISKAYYELISKMWKNYKKNDDEYVNTKDFQTIFCNKTKLFLNHEQEQDAYEFLFSLLDYLNEDLNRVTNKKYMELKEEEGETDEQGSNRWWEYYKSQEDSIIVDLFQGQYKSTIICSKCKNNSISYNTYKILSLPIPSKKLHFQFKFFTNNGNYIDLNVKIDEQTLVKDIILKSITYLDKNIYIDYAKKLELKDHFFNYNITDVPDIILYNNIQIIEFNKKHKIVKIYNPSYNNIINKNEKEPSFDNTKFIDFWKNTNNNSEFVLFEKDINSNIENYVNVYIFPIAEVEKDIYSIYTKTVNKILSFPIIISLKKNDNLKSLQSIIFKKIRKILGNYNYLDAIEICFPHYNNKWDIFKIKDNVCPLCKKAYEKKIKYCKLFNSLDKNKTILNLIKIQDKDMPLILLAKSDYYNKQLSLYKGMELFFDKKNEIQSQTNITLYDSLELLNEGEILDGENMWYCNKCQEKRIAEKKIQLYRTPYYLIIQLKRYNQKNNIALKSILGLNDSLFEYKEVLNLKDFVVGTDKYKSIYDLYGVIVNKKTYNGRHYISYCKNFGKWFSYDDNDFNSIDNPINKDGYLLFYKRRSSE